MIPVVSLWELEKSAVNGLTGFWLSADDKICGQVEGIMSLGVPFMTKYYGVRNVT